MAMYICITKTYINFESKYQRSSVMLISNKKECRL